MKLVSIDRSGFPATAILSDDETEVHVVSTAPEEHSRAIPVSMRDLLDDWQFWRKRLVEIKAGAGEDGWVPCESVQMVAPVPQPRSLICVGLNYRDLASETGAEIPDEPVVFAKHVASVAGPGENVVIPLVCEEVDYEAELGVVIGARASHVTPEEGLAAVAGYTIINDVSARDWQMRSSQWMLSKSFPTFAPMGPAFVTADELGDASSKRITLTVNGEVRQDSSTDELIFGVGELVSHLSKVWELQPGDVLATGTPAGVGVTRSPAVFLKGGDVMEITIEGIGVLRNPVVDQEEIPKGQGQETPASTSPVPDNEEACA